MGNADKFELVTGHGPEPHVDADDHALLYASFIGPGVYRLTGVKTAEIEVTSEDLDDIAEGKFHCPSCDELIEIDFSGCDCGCDDCGCDD